MNVTRSVVQGPRALVPETLLLQCSLAQAETAMRAADRVGGGLTITADRGNSRAVLGLVEHLVGTSQFVRPLCLDANRYSGRNRATATANFSSDWLMRQQELGLTVFTDSGYVAEGDVNGLCSILARARDLGEVTAVLPLHISWLKDRKRLDFLIRCVVEYGIPVALVLEHAKDPLGIKPVLRGLLSLIGAGKVTLLRSDVSTIGSLCYGAFAAAVGTKTSLRHLYPVPKDESGRPSPAKIAAVVKECLAFVSLEKIAFAVQADPDNLMWRCPCRICNNRTMDWMVTLGGRAETTAFGHSAEILFALRDRLLTPSLGSTRRAASWHAMCTSAQFQHEDVADTSHAWDPPPFLGAWSAVATRPAGTL